MNDSTAETNAHIARVRELLYIFMGKLEERGFKHDRSKLESPEKEGFDEVTGALKSLTYGGEEYKAQLEKLKPILDHHYSHNSHHPEHYQKLVCIICFSEYPTTHKQNCINCGNGTFTPEPNVGAMTLLDIVEMFCDWKAATERHENGSLKKSIQHNRERFKLSPQLASILENSRMEMHW